MPSEEDQRPVTSSSTEESVHVQQTVNSLNVYLPCIIELRISSCNVAWYFYNKYQIFDWGCIERGWNEFHHDTMYAFRTSGLVRDKYLIDNLHSGS